MMNSDALLLVVTPTLGESAFLGEVVRSVASLDCPVRHILSAPKRVVDSLQRSYPQLTVVPDFGKEGGIYGALNAGLEAAPPQWDWFTYINDDDRLLPSFGPWFRRHFSQTHPEGVMYGDVELIDDKSTPIAPITVERNPGRIPALLQSGVSPLMQQGTVFSRDSVQRVGRFDVRYRLCGDLDFWVRAYVGGSPFRYQSGTIAQFRIRPGQLSGATEITRREQEDIVRRHLPHPIPLWRRRLARWGYRWRNLPRYVRRIRSRGFLTSYKLLNASDA